jgi:20S proteasome alpha/beta subunit
VKNTFTPPGQGYDRGITTFSPDGRLFQVEYAIEAVRRGTTAIGCRNQEAIILAVEKRAQPLQETAGAEKIFKIDDHIAAAIAGLTADARVLVDEARVEAQISILSYDEKIQVEECTRAICDKAQLYTLNAGARPFGVSFLIAGIDPIKGPQIFMTDPSGAYWGYKANAIGAGAQNAREFLEKEYKDTLSVEDLKKLTLKTLQRVMDEDLKETNCDMVCILKAKPEFHLLSEAEKKTLIASLPGK